VVRKGARERAEFVAQVDIDANTKALLEEIERYRDALVVLSTHDFTSVDGCRRGQLIAAKALRGEPIE
jgi:hypothetical protein